MRIFLFDPSLRRHAGGESINLGDVIIRNAVDAVLGELFPGADVTRASVHEFCSEDQLDAAAASDLVLVGGTNLLSSHVLEYDQWKLAKDASHYAEPPKLHAVLLGTGWWQYQDDPDIVTRHYYRRLLHPELPASVRDEYSREKLSRCGIRNVLNTSCPALWGLDGKTIAAGGKNSRCLFCITDYNFDPESDGKFVEMLLSHYMETVFFPQGDHDVEFLFQLTAAKKAGNRIRILPRSIEALDEVVGGGGIDYIGTRLHAGAACMRGGLPSLIRAVDNRSAEIGKDTGIPVVGRSDWEAISDWINGAWQCRPVRLPVENIAEWKRRVRACAARFVGNSERTAASPARLRPSILQKIVGTVTGARAPTSRFLNLGCGSRVHPDWVNVDFTSNAPGVVAHNLLEPLPFANGGFDGIYCSHVLEHFPRKNALSFVRECRRLLSPGGTLRVVVPDIELLARMYLRAISEIDAGDRGAIDRHEYLVINMIDQIARHEPGGAMGEYWRRDPMPAEDFVVELSGLEVLNYLVHVRNQKSRPPENRRKKKTDGSDKRATAAEVGKFRLSGEPHQWMYDRISLERLLRDAGFDDIRRRDAGTSAIPNMRESCFDHFRSGDVRKPESLYMEASVVS